MHDSDSNNGGRPSHAGLFELASEQGGYFTAAQARARGFSRALIAHHAKSGRFLRVHQGLYRLREYPSSPREDLVAAWLATGREVTVVSHDSALKILGSGFPKRGRSSLTFSRARRYRCASPRGAIHMTTRRLGKSEIVVRDGIRVTAPALSIIDVAEARTAPEQIVAAVGQALDRGIVAESKILGVAKTRGVEVESRALVDGFSRSDSTGEVRSGAAFRQALEQRLLAR